MPDPLVEALQNKLKREIQAREEAERIMEVKSRELFELNLNLEKRIQKGIDENNQFAFALSHCDNAIAIFDSQQMISWRNQAFNELFDYPSHLLPISKTLTNPPHVGTEFPEGIQLAIRTEEYHSFEFAIQKGDSSQSLVASITPAENIHHDEKNRAAKKFVLVISDTTSLRQAEQKIAQQDRHYRGIFDRMGLGLLMLDADHKILDANENLCDELGQQALTKSFWDIFELGKDSAGDKFLSQEICNDVEFRFLGQARSGLPPWFLGSSIPLREDSAVDLTKADKATAHVVTLINISDRKSYELRLKEAREKAEASNQAKRRFVANISHEIKTPVNSLAGLIELIDASQLGTKEQSYFSAIQSSAKTLFSLTSDILDFYRIEENQLEPKLSAFDLRTELNHQAHSFTAQVDISKVRLKFHIDDSVPQFVKGDQGKYLQILANIVGNAIKFTPTGFIDVDLSSTSGEDQLELVTRVTDSGVGIPASLIAKVFDEFERGLSEHLTAEGTGLGLAITKKLVELLGGAITMKSEPGTGTSVEFKIPFQPATQNEISVEDAAVNNLDNVRVLVAEDDSFNQLLFQNVLENANCKVFIVRNGNEAIRVLQSEPVDIILMDVRMPELDGIETTRHLRKTLQNRTPIIGLSANTEDEDRQLCLQAGMNSFLPKPCHPESLVAEIVRMLNKSEGARE